MEKINNLLLINSAVTTIATSMATAIVKTVGFMYDVLQEEHEVERVYKAMVHEEHLTSTDELADKLVGLSIGTTVPVSKTELDVKIAGLFLGKKTHNQRLDEFYRVVEPMVA